jgi:hypothetical protein
MHLSTGSDEQRSADGDSIDFRSPKLQPISGEDAAGPSEHVHNGSSERSRTAAVLPPSLVQALELCQRLGQLLARVGPPELAATSQELPPSATDLLSKVSTARPQPLLVTAIGNVDVRCSHGLDYGNPGRRSRPQLTQKPWPRAGPGYGGERQNVDMTASSLHCGCRRKDHRLENLSLCQWLNIG